MRIFPSFNSNAMNNHLIELWIEGKYYEYCTSYIGPHSLSLSFFSLSLALVLVEFVIYNGITKK